MNAPFQARMSTEDFLEWETRQERRHELVDGVVRLMAGASLAHNTICLNLTSALRERLRGKPCRPFGMDVKIRIPAGNIRYPDVLVDCGAGKSKDLFAAEPRVVMEVLSASNRYFDQKRKLADYQSVPTIEHIVFLAQDEAEAQVLTRTASGWISSDVAGLEGELSFPAIDVVMPMADVYDGVEFEPRPQEE